MKKKEEEVSLVRAIRVGAADRSKSKAMVRGSEGSVNKTGIFSATKRVGVERRERNCSTTGGRRKVYRCDSCRITYEVLAMFRMHRGMHAKHDEFECDDCGYKAEDRVDFMVHFECRGVSETDSTCDVSETD
jgi:hypothetical protein